MSFDLAKALGSIAPTLATMLGGPLAGTAVTALESAFGLSPGSGQDAITKVVQAGNMTPEIMAAVRAQDQKHAEIVGQQGLDLAKLNADHAAALAELEVKDRDGARQREVAVKDATPGRLAYIMVLGFFALSGALVWLLVLDPDKAAKVPQPAWLLIGTIMGYLSAEAKAAAAYYFGGSKDTEGAQKMLFSATPPSP